VRQLVADGYEVTLLYWSYASRELQARASRFSSLDGYLETWPWADRPRLALL
jgi:hypothetical protein